VVLIEATALKMLAGLELAEGLYYSVILNIFSAMAGVILTLFWGGSFFFLTYLLVIGLPFYFRKVLLQSFLEKRIWVFLVSYMIIWLGLPIGGTGLGKIAAGFGIAVFTEVAFALQYLGIESPGRFSKAMVIGNVATHLFIASLIPLLGRKFWG
jgi:hypothetical protein